MVNTRSELLMQYRIFLSLISYTTIYFVARHLSSLMLNKTITSNKTIYISTLYFIHMGFD